MSAFDEKRAPSCDRCNYDTHMCDGCGDPLPHGTEMCDECDEAYSVEDDRDFPVNGYWGTGDYP